MRLLGAAMMFTVLALFLGDAVLAFIGDQLNARRGYRLELARGQTRRAKIERDWVVLVWKGLERDGQPTDPIQP
jgi:hypothetical protein